MALYGLTYTGKVIYIIDYTSFVILVILVYEQWSIKLYAFNDLMIHNMENVTSARYSLLHIDEAMNDIIRFRIVNN